MSMKNNFGRYWYVQIIIISILVGYSILLTTALLVVLDDYNLDQNQPIEEGFVVNLIITSLHNDSSFNYSYIKFINQKQSLINLLKTTVGEDNLGLTDYGTAGYYIYRIFNVSEFGNWHWLYYYKVLTTNNTNTRWLLAPVGVSKFVIDQDMIVKFVFSDIS